MASKKSPPKTLAGQTLSAALEYATAGFRVLPLNGKVPIAGIGIKDATYDDDQIQGLWDLAAKADVIPNVGIATGAVYHLSRFLCVLDVDTDADEATVRRLGVSTVEPPAYGGTVRVRTGSGGVHFYYWCERLLPSSAGALGPGLDVRCEAGYVVAPPSRHPDTGRAYTWESSPVRTIATLPPDAADAAVRAHLAACGVSQSLVTSLVGDDLPF